MARFIALSTLSAAQLAALDTLDVRTVNSHWSIVEDTIEYHDTTEGAQITALLQSGSVRKLGFWYKSGKPLVGFESLPELQVYEDSVEPTTRTAYVNIYRSDETPHGFTIGSRTSPDKDDMIARGLRNASGNYLTTVAVEVTAQF